jgi:hypothetical protein
MIHAFHCVTGMTLVKNISCCILYCIKAREQSYTSRFFKGILYYFVSLIECDFWMFLLNDTFNLGAG